MSKSRITKVSAKEVSKKISEAFDLEESTASDTSIDSVDNTVVLNPEITLKENDLTAIFVQQEKEEHIKYLKQQRTQDSELHDTRKTYTQKLYKINFGWIIVVASFVFLSGLRFPHFNEPNCEQYCFSFSLPENILIAFITSTTATVIGIFIIVAKWLFTSPSKSDSETKEK